MEDYSATIQVTLGMSGGHAESSDVSGGSNHRSNHDDPDPTIWLRDHLLELRPLGPFTVRKTRAGDYVVEHGEDLIGHFPHEYDAVNFASVPLASEDSQIGVRMRVCLYGQDRTHRSSC